MPLLKKTIPTPMGSLVACATEAGVCLLQFSDAEKLDAQLRQISKTLKMEITEGDNALLSQTEQELSEYFLGRRKVFSVPLAPIGTAFQKKVWEALSHLPYGTTISYQQEALLINQPKAVRAVANANGQNKICILIPCHRVIGSNGTLTGYAGGIERKQQLLALETKGL